MDGDRNIVLRKTAGKVGSTNDSRWKSEPLGVTQHPPSATLGDPACSVVPYCSPSCGGAFWSSANWTLSYANLSALPPPTSHFPPLYSTPPIPPPPLLLVLVS